MVKKDTAKEQKMDRKAELTEIWKSPESTPQERGAAMRELQALTSNRPARSLVAGSLLNRPGTRLNEVQG